MWAPISLSNAYLKSRFVGLYAGFLALLILGGGCGDAVEKKIHVKEKSGNISDLASVSKVVLKGKEKNSEKPCFLYILEESGQLQLGSNYSVKALTSFSESQFHDLEAYSHSELTEGLLPSADLLLSSNPPLNPLSHPADEAFFLVLDSLRDPAGKVIGVQLVGTNHDHVSQLRVALPMKPSSLSQASAFELQLKHAEHTHPFRCFELSVAKLR